MQARRFPTFLAVTAALALASCAAHATDAKAPAYVYSDAHFHLTNYVQEGTDLKDYLKMMDGVVKRSAVFGLPLQQMWQYGNTGDFAPYYYLQTDAPLYYYSFTDAHIAMAYRSLTPEQQQRLDPMITGFNPADMYAADHIRRVLLTFPGVFSGIGEFSIHKEFVSSKIAGGPAMLGDPALDRILDFARETGLLVILHNDIDMPFPKEVIERAIMFYNVADYSTPPAIQHPEWGQNRINFQGWPFPSATREVVSDMKETLVGGDLAFLDKLSPDFVAKDLVQYTYIKKALEANPKWKTDLSVPQKGDPFERKEVIEL